MKENGNSMIDDFTNDKKKKFSIRMDILVKINEMMQKIEDETKIFLISPDFAEKLVNSDAESSPNILFMLINGMPENLAYSLGGDLKKDVLKQFREKLVKLYTLEELREQ